MEADDDHVDDYLNKDVLLGGERLSGITPGEVLTRAELDLAYSSEKLMNLEMLLMEVAGRANDYEAFTTGSEGISTESLEDAFEFDLLSGILNSEVKELDDFMSYLQIEIVEARERLSQDDYFDGSLYDAEELLKQSQDRVADLRMQSEKFERTFAFTAHETWSGADEEAGNDHLSSTNANWKLQTAEQQRHALQMLEKSLAREIDLEKKLSDARSNEEELKRKLHYAEQEAYYMGESMDSVLERLLESENAAELFMAVLQELRGKVTTLEEQLKESKSCLQQAKASAEANQEQRNLLHSELSEVKMALEGLKENAVETESRAEIAEAKCTELTKTNIELSEELSLFRNKGADKATILERKLQDSDTQLEHAKASVEAIEEQQNMLHSAIRDMESLIDNLKVKVSKAENRAESAESKCILLTETNLELNEELGILRGRLECVETSLHQSEVAKVATAKDIGIRTKIITGLVTKLTLERERLQFQISALAKRNKLLEEKCFSMKDYLPSTMNHKGTMTASETTFLKSSKEATGEMSISKVQVEKQATATPDSETGIMTSVLSEDVSSGAISKLETVRTIEATQLNPKYLFMAFLVVIVSVVFYLGNY